MDGYEAIETALLASDRGRHFLAEHARRQRATGTVTLLDAICRLEDVIRDSRITARLKENLEETRSVVVHARREIVAVLEDRRRSATAPQRIPDERLTRVLHLLQTLETRVTAMIAFAEPDAPPETPAAQEKTEEDLPSPSAAASLLRKLQSMTPEERRALFK